jgi:hypothetical protein
VAQSALGRCEPERHADVADTAADTLAGVVIADPLPDLALAVGDGWE